MSKKKLKLDKDLQEKRESFDARLKNLKPAKRNRNGTGRTS
jgi:hypothetical protein